jgi:membrane-bound hydrogenase subunit beta
MSDITALAAELQSTFSLPEGAVRVQRATRLWVTVDKQRFPALFDHVVKTMGFSILCTITGLDAGTDLELIYHLARDGGVMVNVKMKSPKGEPLHTVTPYFPGATLYERELEDLLGAVVECLPAGRRYPLPDDWPAGEHPLLKDWAPKEAASAIHGMKAEGEADE